MKSPILTLNLTFSLEQGYDEETVKRVANVLAGWFTGKEFLGTIEDELCNASAQIEDNTDPAYDAFEVAQLEYTITRSSSPTESLPRNAEPSV